MSGTLPALSTEDRARYLKQAADARARRSEVLRRLGTGDLAWQEVLEETSHTGCDPILGRIRVKNFLQSLPNIGEARAQNIMEQVGCGENRRLRGLGCCQREQMSGLLEGLVR